MAAGISITNDYGSVLVDETYKNYRLVRKDTITVANSTGQSAYNHANIVVTGTAPMLAVRGENDAVTRVAVLSVSIIDGQYWFEIIAGQTPCNVVFYIFDIMPDNVGNPGYLQVRDSQGRLTFDSNQKYLRIIEFLSANERVTPYQAGSTEAVVICTPHMGQYGGSDGFSNYGSGMRWRDSGGYVLDNFYMNYTDTSDGGTRPTQEPSYVYDSSGMIIDVTGY